MTLLISFADAIRQLLMAIVKSSLLHAKWLNTLSYLENCGARKIAACEHPTMVKEEMLKHASEEFRHAHYLKRQLKKVSMDPFESYALGWILGGTATLHYLRMLDLKASRYLKGRGLSTKAIREYAYLLVTLSIELRADELYPIYAEILKKTNSTIAVKSILLEEKEHLHEMKKGIQSMPSGWEHAQSICAIEGTLCKEWLKAIAREVGGVEAVQNL